MVEHSAHTIQHHAVWPLGAAGTLQRVHRAPTLPAMLIEWLAKPAPPIGLSRDMIVAHALMGKALRARLSEMGETNSGLYAFYRHKLETRALLSPIDIGTLAFLQASPDRWQRVWEIGAGVGVVGILLAVDGFYVVLVEQDDRRVSAMRAAVDAVATVFPEVRSRVEIRNEPFPVSTEGEKISGDLALGLGLTTGKISKAEQQTFMREIARFGAAIIEFRHLFETATDSAEEIERARAFCSEYEMQPPTVLLRYLGHLPDTFWMLHFVRRRDEHRLA